MNITLKHILALLLLTPRAFSWGSSEIIPGNGLETDNITPLNVLIEEVSEHAKKIGLTRERIEARVNQTLRKAGLIPAGSKDFRMSGGYLYVNVTVIAGGSFSINISFGRAVFYQAGDKWFTNLGSTWHKDSTGYGPDGNYILNSIAEDIEVFCNEFLKANGK